MKTNKTKSFLNPKGAIGIALGIIALISVSSLVLAQSGGNLIAGQNILVGSIDVSKDVDNIRVEYITDGDWVITGLHLQIANDLSGIPQTKTGNPTPGLFEYNVQFDTPVSFNASTKAISELNLTGETVVIAAQADVYNTVTGENETAWADGQAFPGKNWATYFVYNLTSGKIE